jgi:hypothetical protein
MVALARVGLAALLLSAVSAEAAAQSQPPLPSPPAGRVSFGADVSATMAPEDTTAFFNYTDYQHNALRLARVRLVGEWRAASRLAFLGEVRVENTDRPEVAALYLRWRPWPRAAFDVQAGRIPPVVGAFARRAYGRDNPVIGVPLAYQYLTSLRPDALPATVDDLLRMRARGWQPSYPIGSQTEAPGQPLISTSRWDTGVEGRWRTGWLDLAAAWTRGAPAQPVVRETNSGREWSGRAAVIWPGGLTLGVSGAHAQWIAGSVLAALPANGRSPSDQTLVGSDVEFARGPWIVRGEWLRATFGVPTLASAVPSGLRASSSFVEARCRVRPRWQAALRLDQLGFSDVRDTLAGAQPIAWDAPVQRVEGTIGFRARPDLEIRAGWQQNWRSGGRVTRNGVPALQVLWWF